MIMFQLSDEDVNNLYDEIYADEPEKLTNHPSIEELERIKEEINDNDYLSKTWNEVVKVAIKEVIGER